MKTKLYLLVFLIGVTAITSRAQTTPISCDKLSVDRIESEASNPKNIAVTISNHDSTKAWGPLAIYVIGPANDTVGKLTLCGCVVLLHGQTGTFYLPATDSTFRVPLGYCCTAYLKSGTGSCLKHYNTCTMSGIVEVTTPEQIKVYPNPAKEELFVEWPYELNAQSRMTIYNTAGKAVLTELVTSREFRTDVSNLPQGIFLIRCSDEKGITGTQKLLIR